MIITIVCIILSCLIIWKASDGFETASEHLGRNLSDGVKGATLNAIGSSMPEFFTTLFFLFILDNKEGFSGGIGTSAGSAVFNGMIIPAFVILVVIYKGIANGIEVSRKVFIRDGLALLICEAIFIYILGGNSLNWIQGLILMSMYGIYVLYMLSNMKKYSNLDIEENHSVTEDQTQTQQVDQSNTKNLIISIATLDLESIFIKNNIDNKSAWILLGVSISIIGGGCMLLVNCCEKLGEMLHIPIYFIAVVIASAATSVPDTILSIKDAKKGNYDDAVANALGSNIFDICFALGFPLFIYTLIYGPIRMSNEVVENVLELNLLLFICTLVAFFIYTANKRLRKKSAFSLLGIYILFIAYILGKSMHLDITHKISDTLIGIDYYIDLLRFWN